MSRLYNLLTLKEEENEMLENKKFSQTTLNKNGLRRHIASLICAASAALILASLLPRQAAAQWVIGPNTVPKKHPDFNGDSLADLAIGAPGEVIGGGGGAVHVAYGSSYAFVWPVNQQLSNGGGGTSDRFGSALAWGDFNKDGYDDLAVGIPGANNFTGKVRILYGSSSGLGNRRFIPQFLTRAALGRGSAASDRFGDKLAAGDFNGDGYADLAIGVTGNYLYTASAVYIVYGSASGLTTSGNQRFDKGPYIESLAAGDFNKDGRTDLAVGMPTATINGYTYSGLIHVNYGSLSGLVAPAQGWSNATPDMNRDFIMAGAGFGRALAVGDFNNDGYADLAAASQGSNAGRYYAAVHILYGSAARLKVTGNQVMYLDNQLGIAVAAGDFNGDGCSDLATGLPSMTINGHYYAGAVIIKFGTLYGMDMGSGQVWSQDTPDVLGGAEEYDQFGNSLLAADFNRSGHDDLAIGVPGENSDTGAVNVLLGSSIGLTADGNSILMEQFQGLSGNAAPGDLFGTLR